MDKSIKAYIETSIQSHKTLAVINSIEDITKDIEANKPFIKLDYITYHGKEHRTLLINVKCIEVIKPCLEPFKLSKELHKS